MSWAEDDFQSEKMDRSRHRKSREGIASVPEAANPPQGKNRAPCGGLAVREREREREKLSARGEKKAICWPQGGRGGGFWVRSGFLRVFLCRNLFLGGNSWFLGGRAEPPPFLLAKLMKRLP